MKRTFILLAIFGVLGVAAVAQSARIGGRQWQLVELNGTPIDASKAYLELERDETRFSGNAGCNRMFGTVEIRGRTISFSNVGTTRMACSDPRTQKIETTVLNVLKRVDRFRQSGNTLELINRQRVVMKFVAPTRQSPQEPEATVQLEDRKWILESIGNSAVSKIGGTAFVVFDKTRASAGGNSSCNVFGGSYSAIGGALKITEIVSTMRACVEDQRMQIEREFLDALRSANRYAIRNNKLVLYRNDQPLVTLAGESK